MGRVGQPHFLSLLYRFRLRVQDPLYERVGIRLFGSCFRDGYNF